MTSPLRGLVLNTKLGNVNGYLTGFVRDGFESALGPGQVLLTDYHRCILDAKRHRPDFALLFDGQELNAMMVAKLRQIVPVLVLWLTEDPYEQAINTKNLGPFDLVYTNDAGCVPLYEDPRVRHLTLAACPCYVARPMARVRRSRCTSRGTGRAGPGRQVGRGRRERGRPARTAERGFGCRVS